MKKEEKKEEKFLDQIYQDEFIQRGLRLDTCMSISARNTVDPEVSRTSTATSRVCWSASVSGSLQRAVAATGKGRPATEKNLPKTGQNPEDEYPAGGAAAAASMGGKEPCKEEATDEAKRTHAEVVGSLQMQR